MIPKELKALIDEYCMGIKDEKKIENDQMDLIMKKALETDADPNEWQKYMEEVISGPTKAERETMAKAEAERKAKAEAERAEKERLAAIERAKREKREAAERAERERLAAIERAEKEKKEAAARAEREKKEAIFKELKKKYPSADISGTDHFLLKGKPVDQWESAFKASAVFHIVKKTKKISYWVFFTILLIGAFVCEHLFVHGGWDSFLVVSLILVAFGTNGYYRLKGKEGDEDLYAVTTWCAGILWQHYFVHGFWWTTLAIAVIFFIPFIFNYQKHIKLARVITWIVVLLALCSFSLLLFSDIKIVDTTTSVETAESIESSYRDEEMEAALIDDELTKGLESDASNLSVEELLKIKYDYVYSLNSDGLYEVRKNGKYGCCDKSGKLVIPVKYDHIYDRDANGMIKVRIGSLYGYYEYKTYNIIIPVEYDYIADAANGIIKVRKSHKYGWIDAKTYKIIIPVEYDLISDESNGLIKVRKSNKYGFIDAKTYKLVTPCVYDHIYSPEGNLIKVKQGNKIGYLNKDGSLLKKPE